MSKPFAWRDFTKKYDDLSSNNFPTVHKKSKQIQDTLKFKFSSKVQQGVKFDSSVSNFDGTSTEADFNAKVNVDEVKGLEIGFKAKTKPKEPSLELSAKLDDNIVPLSGASVTAKLVATAPKEQGIGVSFSFVNTLANLTLGYTHPIGHRLFDFLEAPTDSGNVLADQKPKVEFDVVAKPLEGQDVYVGGNATLNLAHKEGDELTYNSKIQAGLVNSSFNGGVFVEHKKEDSKKEGVKFEHKTTFGGYAYTEVEDLSGGVKITYTPSESDATYKGVSLEASTGLRRDADSKLSSKVQIIPDTTVSLGYEQNVNKNVKLSFGYSFLLIKNTAESKTKSSAYNFGVEFSH